jgi:hyperosmotically inducible protein
MTRIVTMIGAAVTLIGLAPCFAAQVEPDNTRVNRDDRQNSQPTAQNQSQSKSDVQLAAAVRKAIVGEKSLSTYAHNVKVIARDGAVTLAGPVRSADEKTKVEQLARDAAGGKTVNSNLTVKQ